MTHAPSPANYEYIYQKLVARYGDTLPFLRLLDFGCGDGGLVEYLRAQGLNAVGADPYDDRYGVWQQEKDYLHRIENRRLPFTDEAFDCVVSNQVFEHIPDYKPELAEVKRVLKPGGYFLALFPVLETAYEVHSGIWFAYYLKWCLPLLYAWLYLWRLCGAGLWKHDYTPQKWAKVLGDIVINECHYKCILKVLKDWKKTFGHKPHTHMADYLRFRLKSTRLSFLADYKAPIMTLISIMRAGVVIDITK